MTPEIMKVIIAVPDLKLQGGVANIFNLLKLDKHSHIDYFINTSEKKKLFFIAKMFVSFLIKLKKANLVHLNPSFNSKAIIRDGILLLLAKIMKCKVLVFIHGWDDKYEESIIKNPIKGFLFRKVYNTSNAFIVLGEVFKNKLLKLKINSKNIFLLSTIADDKFIEDEFQRKFDNNSSLKLLFISRFDKNKGMDIAINTLKVLNKDNKELKFELTMAGDGPELNRWKEYVRENNIDNIKFVGHVSGVDKHRLFLNADVLFFPTYYGEGLPCVIMEAMLYGLPIVSRENGGISDWISNGKNGFITPSRNPDDFKKFLEDLVNQPILLQDISIRNHKIAKENFIPSKIDEKLQSIYSHILYKN